MTPVRAAALRLEMAEGHVHAIINDASTSDQEDAVLTRDYCRELLHEEVRKATGMDAVSLARALAL